MMEFLGLASCAYLGGVTHDLYLFVIFLRAKDRSINEVSPTAAFWVSFFLKPLVSVAFFTIAFLQDLATTPFAAFAIGVSFFAALNVLMRFGSFGGGEGQGDQSEEKSDKLLLKAQDPWRLPEEWGRK